MANSAHLSASRKISASQLAAATTRALAPVNDDRRFRAFPQVFRGWAERLRVTTAGLLAWLSSQSRFRNAQISSGAALLVGMLDYLSGSEVYWSVIYIIPIAQATWFVGSAFAYVLSVLSLTLWLASDFALGVTYSSWLVPVWNSAIRLALYIVFIRLLSAVKSLAENLEAKVAARTAELERLERELVDVGERERRRIGADLHDGLGQHLTATSLAAQVLRRQLLARGAAEAQQASAVVALLEESQLISQKLAKGLQPVEIHGGGIMQALQDFASSITEMFKIPCHFRCDAPVIISDVGVAEQLYRIAQEATTNAVKHAHPKEIVISLEANEEGFLLAIEDDGLGFVPALSGRSGMGLRIMERRAMLIGGEVKIESCPGCGTKVSCRLREEMLRG